MIREQPLPVTPTHSGREAKGGLFGLEGMSVVPVLGGAMVTIILVIFMLVERNPSAGGGRSAFQLFAATLPFFVSLAFVLLLVHKKPPGYRRDALILWRANIPLVGPMLMPVGTAFNVLPGSTLGGAHPLLGARAALRDVRDES